MTNDKLPEIDKYRMKKKKEKIIERAKYWKAHNEYMRGWSTRYSQALRIAKGSSWT